MTPDRLLYNMALAKQAFDIHELISQLVEAGAAPAAIGGLSGALSTPETSHKRMLLATLLGAGGGHLGAQVGHGMADSFFGPKFNEGDLLGALAGGSLGGAPIHALEKRSPTPVQA
jgi:hypothetical protein